MAGGFSVIFLHKERPFSNIRNRNKYVTEQTFDSKIVRKLLV